jgi:energy-coupling factor transporter ATP-binding protein EcfA2
MSAAGLRKLSIEAFRGAVLPFSLPFEPGRKLTLLYGENGSGKSTICDAFDFLGNGSVGSLDGRGLGKTAKYWSSVGRKPAEVAVTLEALDGTTCRASLLKGEVVASPTAPRPRVEMLRRSQILGLIEAKPAERYEAIRRFIDVPGVEASEAALRQLVRDNTQARELAATRAQENLAAIRGFWEAAGKPRLAPMVWAEAEAKRDSAAADAELSALARAQVAYARLAEFPARLKIARDAARAAQQAAASTRLRADAAIQTLAADAGELVGVLETARAYLGKHSDPQVCPLCESAAGAPGLGARIVDRLSAFATLQAAQRESNTAAAEVQRAEQQLAALEAEAGTSGQDLRQALAGLAGMAEIARPAAPLPAGADGLEAWLRASAHLPAAWKQAEAYRQNNRQSIGALRRAVETCAESAQAQTNLDAQLPRLKRALEIVEEERRHFTDAILAGIAGEVGRLYEQAHPGEGLDRISLELDPNKRASLEIGASFGGELGTPPGAYFSASHLDTLGICVFLCLAALDDPEQTILVLDDVLASADEAHVERVVEMLNVEARKFRHCLVSAHARAWKDKFRWGWLKSGPCHFVELSTWTEARGLMLIRSVPGVERLRALLSAKPPDAERVSATAGVVLEAALAFLAELYACPVPRRPDGRYALGDLLMAIDPALRGALRVEVLGVDAKGAATYQARGLAGSLDAITRIAQARDLLGSPFSALSGAGLGGEALAFGQAVLELIETLADPQAGWPRNRASGQYWANAGETRRLHPLK